jgi:hypothetical protein
VSGANEYSVNPLALVSTVAPPIVAVFRVLEAAATGLLEPEEPLDEPHAARTATAAAAAASARSIRRRAGRLPFRCPLSPLPRPRIFRVVMASCPLFRMRQCRDGQMGRGEHADAQEHGCGLS